MQPTFTGIPFFVYPVRDKARAKAFYGGVLGLPAGDAWEDKWVSTRSAPRPWRSPASWKAHSPGRKRGAVALEAAQFDEAVTHLKAYGVKFPLEPIDSGVCQFARFEGPDGNHLVLHQKHVGPRR